ncbi:MAG TPA: O-antigen ligase family protein [Terriglobales bacterium]|nr:O-antigen ligase family protein [Terriglobales bacterium]
MSASTQASINDKVPATLTVLFFLLLSGPPRLRIRDATASLDAVIDPVVVLHVIVWLSAGYWLFTQLWPHRRVLWRKLSLPERLGLLTAVALGLSTATSVSPALTIFRVYQLAVTVLFASVFVRKYGVRSALTHIFWSCVVLCAADAIAAFVAPDMVFGASEFGIMRFRGDLIAQTGVVSVLAIVLLFVHRFSFTAAACIVGLCFAVLLFSLMRTGYAALVVAFIVFLLKVPTSQTRNAFLFSGAIVLLFSWDFLVSRLNEYRDIDTLWTLSDRAGLWAYLANMTISQSPWIGLGYYSASRVYGPEYNPGLGTAHSGFMEVFAGGGVIALAVYVALWIVMAVLAAQIFLRRRDRISVTVLALFAAVALFNSIGSALEADPVGFTFWILVVVMPMIMRMPLDAKSRLARAGAM